MLIIRFRLIHRSLRGKPTTTALLAFAYIAWMITTGLSLKESIATLAVLGLQTFIGFKLFRRLVDSNASFVELIGIGLAIGALVSTVIDQAAIALGFGFNPWIPQLVGASVLLITRKRRADSMLYDTSEFDYRLILAAPLIVMVGYGVLGPGWSMAIALLATCLCATFFGFFSGRSSTILGIAIGGIFSATGVLLNAKPTITTYGDWLLRPLYTGSDDLVFSESLGWSLSHFGLKDYAAATGTSVRYHWLSLAWSGLIDKLSGARPFVVTLHVVPVVTFVVVAWSVFALIRLAGYRRLAGLMSVIAMFGTASAIDPHRFYYVLNTSNIASFVWFLLVPYAVVAHVQKRLRGSIFVIPITVCAVLLAKAPFGVASLAGVVVALFLAWLVDHRRIHIAIAVITVVFSVIVYIRFLSPHEWEKRQFIVTWNFAGIAPDSMYYPLIPIILIAAIVVTAFVGVVGIRGRPSLTSIPTLFYFFIGASSVGALRFVLVGNSAELYFFNVTLFCAAIATGIATSVQFMTTDPGSRRWIVGCSAIGFSLMGIEIQYGLLSNAVGQQTAITLSPLIFGSLLTVCSRLIVGRNRSDLAIRYRALFMSAVLASSGALFVNMIRQPEEYTSTTEVASVEDVAALTWLRQSTPTDAIVATNRFLCSSSEPCSFDDSSFLISAVGRRKVLVEGPRFIIGGRPYPKWMTDRILLSTRFAESPNIADLKSLQEFGVTWIVVSERFLPSGTLVESDWANFGLVRYRRDGIAIIQLKS